MDIAPAWYGRIDMTPSDKIADQIPQQSFDLEMKVRDYECDMDYVVNNAVYLNYLEHARHELLAKAGLKFGELSKRGVSLVVTRIEVDYKASLVSGDSFVVRTTVARHKRIRFCFNQSIYRVPDNRLMLKALVTGTALNTRGRPELPEELDSVFDLFSSNS